MVGWLVVLTYSVYMVSQRDGGGGGGGGSVCRGGGGGGGGKKNVIGGRKTYPPQLLLQAQEVLDAPALKCPSTIGPPQLLFNLF